MKIIDTGISNPFLNIAVEEYLFSRFSDDIFLVYISDRSIIIGKHQNPYEEINVSFVNENEIPVIRRISGGGTVYHDKGNLNFSFIRNRGKGKQLNSLDFINIIIDFLSTKGIEAHAPKNNEIRVGGLKVSGNAEHICKNRILHHGTLLFSSDISVMKTALKRGNAKIESKAVASNRASVCNLNNYIEGMADVEILKRELMEYIFSKNSEAEKYILNGDDIIAVKQLVNEKFGTWEWNYAYGPDYYFIKHSDEVEGPDRIEMHIKNGNIDSCVIDGDKNWFKLAADLYGKKHSYREIYEGLNRNNLPSGSEFVYLFLM